MQNTKKTRRFGSKGSGELHTELQALAQRQAERHTAQEQGGGTSQSWRACFFSFALSEVECVSALLGCYLENTYLLYLRIYS